MNYETFYGTQHIGNFVELTECIEALVKAAFRDGVRKASPGEGNDEEIERWNAVHKALAELYELWAKQGPKGTTLGALENLMRAYDKWLD